MEEKHGENLRAQPLSLSKRHLKYPLQKQHNSYLWTYDFPRNGSARIKTITYRAVSIRGP